MKFFFDRNMSVYLARMISALERDHTIEHHDEDPRFETTTPDTEWISVLGKDRPAWVVISGDGRVLRNKAEFSADSFREAKLTDLLLPMSKQVDECPRNTRIRLEVCEGLA